MYIVCALQMIMNLTHLGHEVSALQMTFTHLWISHDHTLQLKLSWEVNGSLKTISYTLILVVLYFIVTSKCRRTYELVLLHIRK